MGDMRRVPEAFVAWLWARQAGQVLLTTDGRAVRVIYPGRRYGSWGPDFHGALFTLDGSLARGDVEIHVRGSDWAQHRHGSDPAYAGVVLHVVLAQGPRPLAVGPGGGAIPTVELSRAFSETDLDTLSRQWALDGSHAPAPTGCLAGEEALARLDRAGLARFRAKAARFEGDFTCASREQALWSGLLEALGYAANVAPFRSLADRVPLDEARSLAASDGAASLEAILLGESGLLPSQRGVPPPDDYAEGAESAWARSGRSGPRVPLGWRTVGVRPGNNPVRRVVAAAQLVADGARWPMEVTGRAALLDPPPRKAGQALASLIALEGGKYWAAHGDFGRPLARPSALIGQQRARDAVVNVLLPWLSAVGEVAGERRLRRAAEAAYAAHPPLASNQITRHMARQILGRDGGGILLNAQRQQGLIQIYRGWCDLRDCGGCPAGPHRASLDADFLAQTVC